MPADNEPSDQALTRQAQQGQREAFTMLYERYLPTVYNRVRYMVPADDVEDVTQEIFISVLKSLSGFRGNARFRTWLRTLTDRRIADYYKSRERQDNRQEAVESDPTAPVHAGEPLVQRNLDERILIQRALRALPDHYRDIVVLRFAEGLPFKEIAREMGISLEAAKSLYRRAITALRDELEG